MLFIFIYILCYIDIQWVCSAYAYSNGGGFNNNNVRNNPGGPGAGGAFNPNNYNRGGVTMQGSLDRPDDDDDDVEDDDDEESDSDGQVSMGSGRRGMFLFVKPLCAY